MTANSTFVSHVRKQSETRRVENIKTNKFSFTLDYLMATSSVVFLWAT